MGVIQSCCGGSKISKDKLDRKATNVDELHKDFSVPKLFSNLGKGGYGSVYKATHKKDPTLEVAIKVINKSQLEDD